MKLNKFFSAAIAVSAAVTVLAGCSGREKGFDYGEYITVVSREDGSGTRGAFIELMGIEEKKDDGTRTDRTTLEAIITSKTDVMLTNVAGDEYAIGYISLGSLNDTVKALKIDGVEVSPENINNGSYKIARPFNIAIKDDISPVAQDFIDFILSSEGQAVIGKDYIAIDAEAEAYSGSKPKGKAVVAGSSSVSPIMEKLKEAYEEINTNATIDIQTSDSTAGMTSVIDGTSDIGMASRSLKDSELQELKPITIAMDGIVIVVNKENPLEDLSSEDVKNIYTGEITTWGEISDGY